MLTQLPARFVGITVFFNRLDSTDDEVGAISAVSRFDAVHGDVGLRYSAVRAAATTSLCVGMLLAGGGQALAAPSEDDAIAPAVDRQRDEEAKPASDLQTFLDSVTQAFNDNVGTASG